MIEPNLKELISYFGVIYTPFDHLRSFASKNWKSFRNKIFVFKCIDKILKNWVSFRSALIARLSLTDLLISLLV